MRYLEKIGELGIIEIFRKGAIANPDLLVGIGDDCAILNIGRQRIAISCDAMIEGVHFLSGRMAPDQLGWKALASALSDLAACGARPAAAFLVLGLRGSEGPDFLRGLARGINRCARRYGVSLAGGDTVRSPAARVVSFTVIGRLGQRRPVLRAGARRGDVVGVCGTLGDAAAGLDLLLARGPVPKTAWARRLLRAQLLPRPQFAESRLLGREVSAMIDTSDGLLRDLSHICRESGVGARLEVENLPLSPALRAWAACRKKDPLPLALSGGEDYRLLFTVPAAKAGRLFGRLHRHRIQATAMGTITGGRGIKVFRNGREIPPLGSGFDHFKKGGGR